MIKYLIIDDEPIAHDIIKNYCDLLSNMQLMTHCYDALEALEYLRKDSVDLIFLDLNMPKLKGFDFLKTLSNRPNVIVTTAYREHALEGFELNVVDYLLKPFSFERFLQAVNKVVDLDKSSNNLVPKHLSEKEHLFLYSDKKHIQVRINNILFIEAAGNYCKVVLKNKNILVREKVSDILAVLPSAKFTQVHKSFIICKKHIDTIEGNRILIEGHKIPIGKLYKSNVLELLK